MTKENNLLFSREALDKLRSPDRLDKMVSVTSPTGWALLAAVAIFIGSILLWAVFGSFTVAVEGMGLIMDAAGTVNVSHISGGKIVHFYAKYGMPIAKGDLIAQVEQAEKSMDATMARQGLGLATSGREAMSYAYQYDQKRQQQLVTESIYSDYDGIVDEVMVDDGTVISGGMPICRIRLTQGIDELTGVLYIPVEKGKRVKQGMLVQVAPSGAEVAESGSLVGIVRQVSQYPLSAQGAQKSIGNAYLAQWIAEQKKSALMEVRFDLVKDESNEYLWTSVVGDRPDITAGSFCKGSIVIERKPPIEKVFYKVSQWLRSR